MKANLLICALKRFSAMFCVLMLASCSQSNTALNGGVTPAVPDSVKAWLTGQSKIIGFYAAAQQDSNYLDTVILPQWAAQRAFQAIAWLWLDSGLAERDTVFDVYALREHGDNDFHSIDCVCGDQSKYQALLDSFQFSRDTTLPLLLFRSPLLLNTIGVASGVNECLGYPRKGVPGVPFICAEPNWFGGDGDWVTATFEQNGTVVEFSVGYGDCPAGCLRRRSWKFGVSSDGKVQFLGATGDHPPTQAERRG
jgi:hypothetical protein